MSISFNAIPNSRVPFVFVEFDSSNAQQGSSLQSYNALLVGQRLSTGTKAAGTIDKITSASQARDYYGPGSMLASMCEKFFLANKFTSLSAIALDDDGGGVKATGTITIVGTASAAGTLHFSVAGRAYNTAVASGDDPTAIATAMVASVTADADKQVTASNVAGVVTFTYVHAGEVGNEVDIRVNPVSGQDLPAGVTSAAVAGMSGGTTNPSLTSVVTAMADDQFHVIGLAYTDATSLSTMETELDDRWGPIRQIEGQIVSAKRDSFANLITFGDGRNSKHVSVMGMDGPSNPYDWAASLAGVVSFYGAVDPARPFQTLPLPGITAPDSSEQFTFSERDQLLKDGIATYKVVGGVVVIDRLITMYQTNNVGADDTAYLDVNTLLTLSYIRYDFRTMLQTSYPRHKLANDGTNFAAGQAIITPKVAKAEAVNRFKLWEENGLVEGLDQFKRDLIVERSKSDPSRLEFLLPTDLINQFRVGAVQIGFLL
jgi:phage tail sheath gpL-like